MEVNSESGSAGVIDDGDAPTECEVGGCLEDGPP